MSDLTIISTINIETLIKDVLFENMKSTVEEHGIELRTLNDESNLYLLVANKNETNLTPIQMECNGLIFEKNTNKIVCMAQNKMYEISSDEILKDITKTRFRMEYCEDGTVIRLYNYNNEWFTATSRCIDARRSYWSSEKTFNDMFFEIFNNSGYDINELNLSCTYSFILIHKENRIVVNHKYNNLIYINRVNNISREEDFTNYFYNEDPRRCIRRTKQIETSNDINYPLDDYYQPEKRGVIIKSYDELNNKWNLFSYDFKTYLQVKEIRGNVPLIRMRYLELLNEPENLELLRHHYPEHLMIFSMIKHCMNKLYKEIHNLYFQSHIKHSITIEESHPLYKTMRQLHGIYKKQKTIITLEIVTDKVNTLNPHVITNLLGWRK